MDPQKDMVYNPEESLSFEGETGPYVQYAGARINSILRKHGQKVVHAIDYSPFQQEREWMLLKKIHNFSIVRQNAMKNKKPSLLCHYLLDLSQGFNEFYHNERILQAEEKYKRARLVLAEAILQVITEGLELLGIEVLQEM